MNKNQQFSDTRETIQRASEASGAREMLDELAKKMRGARNHSGEREWEHPKSSICDELIAIVSEPYKGQIIGIPKIYKKKALKQLGGTHFTKSWV